MEILKLFRAYLLVPTVLQLQFVQVVSKVMDFQVAPVLHVLLLIVQLVVVLQFALYVLFLIT